MAKEEIVTILNNLIKNEIPLLLQHTDANNLEHNTVGKIKKINTELQTATIEIIDHGILFSNQNKAIIKCWWISDFNKYSFECSLIEITKTNIEIQIPAVLAMRKIRKYARVNNTSISASRFIKDISISGISFVQPSTEPELAINIMVSIIISLPFLSNNNIIDNQIVVVGEVVRKAKFSNTKTLFGIEFRNLNKINQMLIYQYILLRKNEITYNICELPSLKIIELKIK
ncbi:MAG: PilZ domain-containing protein [Candidatus Margulisiibacteriota bacterium]|jgi:hypothetical protein